MGDPSGIGPEIAIKAIIDFQKKIKKANILFATSKVLSEELISRYNLNTRLNSVGEDLKISHDPDVINVYNVSNISLKDFQFGIVNKNCAIEASKSVEFITQLAIEKKIKSVVCAPINKESFLMAKPGIPGHTEFIAGLTKISNFGMFFTAPTLSSLAITGHIPLKDVANRLNANLIFEKIKLSREAFIKFYRINPSIAVCGLDPHCGENGLLNNFDSIVTREAIDKCVQAGFLVEGPLSSDGVFRPYIRDRYNLIIGMYHDQIKSAIAALNSDEFVSVLAGVPFLRTTTTNGSAFDIAGKGIANPYNMKLCLEFSEKFSF